MALSVRYRIWLPPWCLADEGAQQRVAAWLDRKGLAACGNAKLCAVGRGLQHAVPKSWLAVHSDELDNNTALNIQVLITRAGSVSTMVFNTHYHKRANHPCQPCLRIISAMPHGYLCPSSFSHGSTSRRSSAPTLTHQYWLRTHQTSNTRHREAPPKDAA